MLKEKPRLINCHTHTSVSNIRLLDSTNLVDQLLETAVEMDYQGLAITEHEAVSSHISAIQHTRKLKKSGKMPKDFKLILGNEIYLCNNLEEVKDNYEPGVTKFPHFVLLAKTKLGHEQLRILSSRAWKRSFKTGLMERTPTLKSDIEEIIKPNQGHIIGSSACLGSEINIHLLAIKEANENNDQDKAQFHREKLNEFILWCIEMFGQDHFFIELQPALSWEQIYCNKELIKIAEHYELRYIITTDAHYLRPEDAEIHKAFLNAKDGEREVASFYEACFLQSVDEIYERMDYLGKDIVTEAINNTQLIGNMVEDYTIEHETVIPTIQIPDFKVRHIFKPAYEQYEYIKKMAYSEEEQNRYLIKLIEDGFYERLYSNTISKEYFHQILARVNVELGELWEISEAINQTMGSYYITVKEIVDLIWDDSECGGNSLVGSGRGSAAGFILNYILGITQVNPLVYEVEMPHWRHLHRSRPDVGALDIDLDTEGSKRPRIINALKKHFGEDRVLQVATFGTETPKAAITTACRGLGYDSDIALHLGSLIPFDRGKNWSISDCLYGNEEKGRKPVREFINEIEKYPKLKETAEGLNGLISRRGIHAGGVILFPDKFYKSNAMMKAPNGTLITAFDLGDSQALGNIKFDLLTIECLDKIRVTLDMLIENGEIEKQKTLRDTFDKYLHPDSIDKESKDVYDLLGSGEVADLFQFSTDIGYDSITKVKPSNLVETASVNSLMRLMSDSGEQPIDTFIRFKNDIGQWYKEMKSYGLNTKEIEIMKEYLEMLNGVADTQEVVMSMSMDNRIAGFSIQEANKLRKIIASANRDAVSELKQEFMNSGQKLGNRKVFLDYVWNVQIARQLAYSFSILHTISYTLAALQEINLNLNYNPLYWETACLIVNSGGIESEEDITSNTSNVNYGKIASAIGNIQSRKTKVLPPNINSSGYTFTPDIENNAVLYGLKGLVGVGDDTIDAIVENRPYTSFQDFLTRMIDTKLVQNAQILQLIKAGCFDSFSDRTTTLREYISHVFEPRKKLTLASFNMLHNELNIFPEEFDLHVRFYNYRKHISKTVHSRSESRKTKNRLFQLDEISTEFLYEHFSEDCIIDYNEETGLPIIAEWIFEREYDKKMQPIKDWLDKESTVELVNKLLLEDEWDKAGGNNSISANEMSSLSYYYSGHELAHLNKEKYNTSNFNELPSEPVSVRQYEWRGREMHEYQISRIAGTVLDKDKNRHTVTILTTDGVVVVKLYRSQYSYLDRQISRINSDGSKTVLERSWFTRGNKLLITGYRRGNQFVPKVYKTTVYDTPIILINSIDEEGNLGLVNERIPVN